MRAARRARRRHRLRQPRLADDLHGPSRRRRGLRDRLAGLPRRARGAPGRARAGWLPAPGLLATHGDWDHLLGRLAFPDASLGCAESTAARIARSWEPPSASFATSTRSTTSRIAGRSRWPACRRCRCPESSRSAPSRSSSCTRRRPHRRRNRDPDSLGADSRVRRLPLAGGDPDDLRGRLAAEYPATLERLQPLVERSDMVVPGHGAPMPRERALTICREDLEYLDELERKGLAAPLPGTRRRPPSAQCTSRT